jgi:hypothetical protein
VTLANSLTPTAHSTLLLLAAAAAFCCAWARASKRARIGIKALSLCVATFKDKSRSTSLCAAAAREAVVVALAQQQQRYLFYLSGEGVCVRERARVSSVVRLQQVPKNRKKNAAAAKYLLRAFNVARRAIRRCHST